MREGRTVFAQVMDFLPKCEFDKCVRRDRGDFHVRWLTRDEQFLIMAFAQLTWRESLRDIETWLRALGPKLDHAGIRSRGSRSTPADANEKRPWQIQADEDFGGELQGTAHALDSTTIDLWLALFPWAKRPTLPGPRATSNSAKRKRNSIGWKPRTASRR